MIFQWDPDVPLVVDENIELPQLRLVKNYTADCTQVYSTGEFHSGESSMNNAGKIEGRLAEALAPLSTEPPCSNAVDETPDESFMRPRVWCDDDAEK